jgi:hypothetical protein
MKAKHSQNVHFKGGLLKVFSGSHCNENPIYVYPEKELRKIYDQDPTAYFPAAE